MSGDGFTFLGYPADTYAAASHSHAGADITSGTVAYGRLPVGTAASTVAIGDHTHATLAALTVAGNTVHPQPALPSDRGWIAWNMPVQGANGAGIPGAAGILCLYRIRRVPATTITNIVTLCTAAGSVLTSGQCFAALYTAAGALVAQTVDQAAAWASNGVKTMALSSAQPVAAGDYYVGMWHNGTTGPTFLRWNNSTGNAVITNAGTAAPNLIAATTNDTGLTTLAPTNFGTQTANSQQIFVALS